MNEEEFSRFVDSNNDLETFGETSNTKFAQSDGEGNELVEVYSKKANCLV